MRHSTRRRERTETEFLDLGTPTAGRFHSLDWLIDQVPCCSALPAAASPTSSVVRSNQPQTVRRANATPFTQNGEALAVRTTGSTDTARLFLDHTRMYAAAQEARVRLHPHALPMARAGLGCRRHEVVIGEWMDCGSTDSSTAAGRSPTKPCTAFSPRRWPGEVRPRCTRTCSPRPYLWSARCQPHHGR